MSTSVSLRAAVVGAGPSGFYTAGQLLGAHDNTVGEAQGRPRVKLVRLAHMHDIAAGTATPTLDGSRS